MRGHGCLSVATLPRFARLDRGRQKRLNALFWPVPALRPPRAEPESSKLRKCSGYPGKATLPKSHPKPPKATTKPYTRHILGIDSGVQSHLKEIGRAHV